MSARRLPITLRPSSVVVLMLILSLLLGATAVPGHALTPQSAEGYGTPATPHSPLLAPNQCAPPPSNIVAWWPLDEQAGAVAADIIGSNDGAHQNGPTPVPGMVDYALSFDGVDDNVVVDDDPALDFGTGDFSLEAWIEGTRSTANIVSKRTSHGNPGYLLMLYSGHLLLQMSDDVDGWYNFYSPDTPNLADGNWHHVAVTVDRDDPEGGRMYADGEPIYTFNPTRRSGNMDSPAPFWIGVEDGTGNYFTGKIDEVSLYKRALTATEVQAIFNADSSGKCKTPPCMIEVALDKPAQKGSLDLLRRFRDEVMAASPAGQTWIDRYYRHAPEAARILLLDAKLRTQSARLIEEFMPAIEALLGQGGQDFTLTAGRLSRANALLAALSDQASPELRAALVRLQAELAAHQGQPLGHVWQSLSQ